MSKYDTKKKTVLFEPHAWNKNSSEYYYEMKQGVQEKRKKKQLRIGKVDFSMWSINKSTFC